MRTAEELRIKGLAEVSWNDENGDGKRTKNKAPNVRQLNVGEPPVTTVKLQNQTKRHSISNNNNPNSNPNSSNNANEMDPLAEASANHNNLHRNDVEETIHFAAKPISQLMHHPSSVNSPHREENVPPVKKKRGRPPLDDDFDSYSTPKISHVESTANNYETNIDQQFDDNSHDPISRPSSILEQSMEVSMNCDDDEPNHALPIQPKIERPDTPPSRQDYYDDNEYNPQSPMDDSADAGISQQVKLLLCSCCIRFNSTVILWGEFQIMLTPQEEAEWRDVIKMNDYLAKGRRPQFWEETFTKRVMEAIKSKELEMKKAAQLLGVSYGTLYGRYRETYGCLKHPYR